MTTKYISRCVPFAALLLAGCGSILADNVTVGNAYSGNIWQNWSVSQISNQSWQNSQTVANQPYWNNSSWDGKNENVGGCLAVVGSGCAVPNQPGNIPYLGQSNGKALSDFYFTSNGSSSVTMQAQVAGDAANDVFGWYNVNNPSQLHILINGSHSIGTTVTFTPSAEYGFFFSNNTKGVDETFYTDAALGADSSYQHFAVFQQSAGTYYLGMEDLPSCNTDFDYNDMVVKLSTVAAPEPSSVLLLACGLLGFGAIRFRSKKAAAAQKN